MDVSTPTGSSVQKDSTELLEFEGDIDPDFNIPHQAEILIISNDQSYLTHGIHKFPAKFFPELPRYLIRKYSREGQHVLDPMCGSGTVPLEAILSNRNAVGIDVDPMARLITKTKTTVIDDKILRNAQERVIQAIGERKATRDYTPAIPEFNYRDTWFRDHVLRELGMISESILETDFSESVTDFLRVVFSSIIRDVSNADPHCTRTVIRKNLVKKIEPGDTITRFCTALSKQIEGMRELFDLSQRQELGTVQVPEGNAIETELDDDSINLAVTSPPYINAVDYPRTHQLEMYWLGLVEDGPLSNMKRRYIGTETVYKKEYEQLRVSDLETLDPILAKIFEQDPRRSFVTYKFFEDMELQFQEMSRVLEPGGHYCVAIGNNVIRGIEVPSHEVLCEIATSDEIGFRIDKVFFSALIRHFIRIPRRERMPGEWILILEKT
ncbi:MAG: DNA methyltransferase [Promethearchaeota archaeon]